MVLWYGALSRCPNTDEWLCLNSEKLYFFPFFCRLGIYHYRLEKLTGGISGSLRIIRLTGMLFFLVFTKWLKRERENTASPMLRAMLIIFMLFSVNEFTKAYNLKQVHFNHKKEIDQSYIIFVLCHLQKVIIITLVKPPLLIHVLFVLKVNCVIKTVTYSL